MSDEKEIKEVKEEEVPEDEEVAGEGVALTKNQKKRLAKKRAAQRKKEAEAAGEDGAEEGAEEGADVAAEGGEGEGASKKKKKKKKKKGGLTEQTWPNPTVPVSKQFPLDAFPAGQIQEYHQDWNLSRITNEEKRNLERLENVKYNELRRGAEVHRQVRKHIQQYIKPGMLMIDICNELEGKVMELIEADGLKAGKAFPTGCSINHCAAHWTPNSGDKVVLGYDDVVKFDFGTHINGRIIDCAWTHNFNEEFDPLKEAVRAATEEGMKQAGVDVRLNDVGAMIQEVMESHEVEIKKKIYTVKCIENLNGHSINPYHIHAGKSVPLVANKDMTKMEEGEVYAIETFGSTGKGYVREEMETSHYMKNFESYGGALRNPKAKSLLGFINKNFDTLAFCRKWLDQMGETKHLLALRSLVCEL